MKSFCFGNPFSYNLKDVFVCTDSTRLAQCSMFLDELLEVNFCLTHSGLLFSFWAGIRFNKRFLGSLKKTSGLNSVPEQC